MANQNKNGGAMPAINDVVESLKERQKRLDNADTRLSERISEIEDELRKHVNIRVWTDISDPDELPKETNLAFGKLDGKWQLLVEVHFPDGDSCQTPLLSCSRETRVFVFAGGHVEALIRGAAAQLDQQLAIREKAIQSATNIVVALGGELPF